MVSVCRVTSTAQSMPPSRSSVGKEAADGEAEASWSATRLAGCSSPCRGLAVKDLEGLCAASQRPFWTGRAKALIPPIHGLSSLLRLKRVAAKLQDDMQQSLCPQSERSFGAPGERSPALRGGAALTANGSRAWIELLARVSWSLPGLSKRVFGCRPETQRR